MMIAALLLSAAACSARGPLPDPRCTPGDVRTTDKAVVCKRGSSGQARAVTEATKRRVYAAYGLKPVKGRCCEVDHLISLELGGSNDEKNLWPESYVPVPGAHQKDLVENHLHAEVCAGTMTLQRAQHVIQTDWVSEYKAMSAAQSKAANVRRR